MSALYSAEDGLSPSDIQDDTALATFFVRALYDYQSTDASSLSFRRGDLIEVLTQLESGWWDGLLDEERGWFPSNYVKAVSDQEAEEELAHRAELTLSSSSLSTFDDSSGSRASHTTEETEWPGSKASEFWMPHLTTDGQIYYLNTKTGQQSRDLPTEMEEDLDGAQLHLDQPLEVNGATRSRADTGDSSQYSIGFGSAKRSKTPEPWEKRLADDGMSFYYFNPITGAIQWSPPTASEPRQSIDKDVAENDTSRLESAISRLRVDSDTPPIDASLRRASVYSDDSEINPFEGGDVPTRIASAVPEQDEEEAEAEQAKLPEAPPVPVVVPFVEELSPENAADQLQAKLLPPPLETIDDLSALVRDAISSVVDAEGWAGPSNSLPGGSSRQLTRNTASRVSSVVVNVRNLLYASGTLAAPLSSLTPAATMDEPVESARSPFTELKPYQRKVTATLSKLVLSARAANSNPDWPIAESSSRVDDDAAELERAVVTFVLEAQRLSTWTRTKRLHGVFTGETGIAGIGLGLFGGGVGGHSKGLGFVPLLGSGTLPQRRLEKAVAFELSAIRADVNEKLGSLETTISKRGSRAGSYVVEYGRLATAHINSFLALLEDIDVATHVDVEGLRLEHLHQDISGAYTNDVRQVRLLIRTLEAVKQALYDDGALLFLKSQAIFRSFPGETNLWQDVVSAIGDVRSDLQCALETLDALIELSERQMEAIQSGIQGRVGSKGFRISHAVRGRADSYPEDETIFHPHPNDASDSAAEDMVDMELALGTKGPSRFDNNAASSFYSDSSISRPSAGQSGVDQATRQLAQHAKSISKDTFASTDGLSGTDIEDDRRRVYSPPVQRAHALRGRANGAASPAFDSDGKAPPRAAKIKKFFGQDAPEHYILRQNADAVPWYLRPTYEAPQILINPDGGIRGGTLPALIERLTMHDYRDATFNETFLMTFKSFSTVTEIFDLLVERFQMEVPEGLTPEEGKAWSEQKQKPIRIRVMNAIRSLIDVVEKEDAFILERIKEFLISVSGEEPTSKLPLTALERLLNSSDGGFRRVTQNIPTEPPPPILPKSSMRKPKLLDFDTLELARQLTLKESGLFFKIRPSEILARAKESSETDSIKAIISTTNKIAEWVADSVLSKDDVRKRALIIKHFILIAERCRSIYNFSSMAALIAGLNTPPIRRLKRTWEQVNAKMIATLDDLEKTMDSNKNFTEYRAKLATVSPPCVPFLGVYLTTLTFIQDGNKDFIDKENNVINFNKRQKAAEVIREIKHYQSKPYNFAPVESIKSFLEESLSVERTSDYYWDLSLQREPREREDEKMARLLQESGFL